MFSNTHPGTDNKMVLRITCVMKSQMRSFYPGSSPESQICNLSIHSPDTRTWIRRALCSKACLLAADMHVGPPVHRPACWRRQVWTHLLLTIPRGTCVTASLKVCTWNFTDWNGDLGPHRRLRSHLTVHSARRPVHRTGVQAQGLVEDTCPTSMNRQCLFPQDHQESHR